MIVLERGEYVSVRKSHVGMWVTVSRHFAKGIGEVRMKRISQVKNESASRVMIIRKQHPSCRHHIFRMMDLPCLLVRSESSDQLSIGWRLRIGIYNGKKIIAFF